MRARRLGVVMATGCALVLAPAAAADTVTLGSTSGTPTQNLCAGGVECTYVPFNNVYAPSLVVPYDGTITSFSVNTGSAAGTVRLRVLRPASGGRLNGAGTSAPAALSAAGVLTFATSLPVRSGDVLGLDNDTSALLFDPGTPTTFTAYYQLPSLGDGASAAPSHIRAPSRLLLSAVLQYTPPAPGGGGGGGPSPGVTPTAPECVVPNLRNLTLGRARQALAAAHCALGKVTRGRHRRVKRGRVISQTPPPRWRRDAGARVDVKVSSGRPRTKR